MLSHDVHVIITFLHVVFLTDGSRKMKRQLIQGDPNALISFKFA